MRNSTPLVGRTALLLGLLLATSLHAQDTAKSSIDSKIPFELVSNFLVVVNVRIAGLDGLKFIVDTGTTYTVIDRKVADKLRLRREPGKITNFDRDVPVEWAEIPELRVGPLRTGVFRVLVAKLSDYSEFAENVDGIIGLNLLGKSKKLFIDYERQTVSLEMKDDGTADRSVPTYLAVPLVVQGYPMHLVIDTGFQGILFYRDRLRKGLPDLRTEGEETPVEVGRFQTTQVKLPGVRILGPEIVATVFLMDGPDASKLPGIDGYLGIASLHAKQVEFDFVAKTLRWQ